MNTFSKTIVLFLVAIVIIVGVYFAFGSKKEAVNNPVLTNTQQNTNTAALTTTTPLTQNLNQNIPVIAPSRTTITAPIDRVKERISKKPFGMYITRATSPVQPEKFTGYHTGVDFETLADEQKTDVPIHAICSGPLVLKKYATGYGGVAVQSCTIDAKAVTVVYGHVRLSSIQATGGTKFAAGDVIGVLGTGSSTETDGERKHLHLGIHKGTAINIKGYVQTKSELDQWIDAALYL